MFDHSWSNSKIFLEFWSIFRSIYIFVVISQKKVEIRWKGKFLPWTCSWILKPSFSAQFVFPFHKPDKQNDKNIIKKPKYPQNNNFSQKSYGSLNYVYFLHAKKSRISKKNLKNTKKSEHYFDIINAILWRKY